VQAIFTTPIFDAWFVKLGDRTAAARVQARIDRLEMGTRVTARRSATESWRCESTMDSVTACIS